MSTFRICFQLCMNWSVPFLFAGSVGLCAQHRGPGDILYRLLRVSTCTLHFISLQKKIACCHSCMHVLPVIIKCRKDGAHIYCIVGAHTCTHLHLEDLSMGGPSVSMATEAGGYCEGFGVLFPCVRKCVYCQFVRGQGWQLPRDRLQPWNLSNNHCSHVQAILNPEYSISSTVVHMCNYSFK